ncbi:MAG: TIM barrel protein [Thalassotalea sp.]
MMDRRKFISQSFIAGIAGTGLVACALTNSVDNSLDNNGSADGILSLAERQQWLSSFACNIELWFKELAFLDRINAAKAIGFSAIEIWNPISKSQGKTPELIAQRAKELNIKITNYSPNAPELADINNSDKFLAWLDIAIASGKTLGASNFNLTGHRLIKGLTEKEMIANYIATLKLAVPKLEAANMIATIEPYNPFNHPGHFIYGAEPGLSICRTINSPSVKLNWDFFHMQRTNGNLITHLENGFDQIAYSQLADSPDRNQPGTGEVAYGLVLSRLRALGYKGYIGAECKPKDKDALKAASDLAALAKRINLAEPGRN